MKFSIQEDQLILLLVNKFSYLLYIQNGQRLAGISSKLFCAINCSFHKLGHQCLTEVVVIISIVIDKNWNDA